MSSNHGTRAMWRKGCRCDYCTKKQERREQADLSRVAHGTTTGYNYGCRCEDCTEAVNIYQRAARGGTKPKNPAPKYGTVKSRKVA